jgi:hypothetical protein
VNSIECTRPKLYNNIKKKYPRIIIKEIPNDKYYCYSKWKYFLDNINYSKYNNIILANDSFLITRSLNDYKKLITPNVELVTLLDSNETKIPLSRFFKNL